jgi:hypothetical protein
MDAAYTAGGAYGYSSYSPAVPGGVAVMPETNIGVSGHVPSGVLPKLPINWHNPLFWLLLLALAWSGYVYGAFDIGFKKLGSTSVKLGGR